MADVVVTARKAVTRSVKSGTTDEPSWLNASARAQGAAVRNILATSEVVEDKIITVAMEGLKAMKTRYDRDGDVAGEEPDHSTRYKYWHDICVMKKWLDKTDVNIDFKQLNIDAREMEILKNYAREDISSD